MQTVCSSIAGGLLTCSLREIRVTIQNVSFGTLLLMVGNWNLVVLCRVFNFTVCAFTQHQAVGCLHVLEIIAHLMLFHWF